MENRWSDQMHERFDDFEVPVPDDVWGGIEAEMQRRANRRKMVVLWGRRALAMAAAVVIAVLLGIESFNTDPALNMGLEEAVTVADNTAAESGTAEQADVEVNLDNEVVTDSTTAKPDDGCVTDVDIPAKADGREAVAVDVSTVVVEPSSGAVGTDVPDSREQAGNTVSLPVGKQNTGEPSEAGTSVDGTVGTSDARRADEYDRNFTELVYGSKKSGRKAARTGSKFTADLYAASVPVSASASHAGYAGLTRRAAPQLTAVNTAVGQNPLTDIMIYNRNSETTSEAHHRQPVRVGLTFCYNISNRLGVETGVTYTYLWSSLVSGSDNNRYDVRQILHYVGVPLNLNVNIWRNRLLDVYVSAGGLMEKCVSGRSRTEYIIGGSTVSTKTEDVMVRQLQWSVNASAGLQLNLSRHVGLYVEPGVSYAFDNGSDVETIYSKHPVNFDLTVGFRFSFK